MVRLLARITGQPMSRKFSARPKRRRKTSPFEGHLPVVWWVFCGGGLGRAVDVLNIIRFIVPFKLQIIPHRPGASFAQLAGQGSFPEALLVPAWFPAGATLRTRGE